MQQITPSIDTDDMQFLNETSFGGPRHEIYWGVNHRERYVASSYGQENIGQLLAENITHPSWQ